MFEHPAITYDAIVAERQRVDRANELRRIIAENPSRVVTRERPLVSWMRKWFGARRADAAASSTPADSRRVIGETAGSTSSPSSSTRTEHPAQPAHAR